MNDVAPCPHIIHTKFHQIRKYEENLIYTLLKLTQYKIL